MDKYRLLIVGAGAAGMSAATAAWNSGVKDILLVDRKAQSGGILTQCVHRGFGLSLFGEELTGPEYARRLRAALAETGVESMAEASVLSVSADRTALISGREGIRKIAFEKMILAAGCREKTLGSLPVGGTRPAGIFTAGQAQEMINLHGLDIGDEIVILGSGDLGMILARRCILAGKRVVAVVEKSSSYGGMARNYHRCIEQYAVPVLFHSELVSVHGYPRISSVTVRDVRHGATSELNCDTLITAVGLVPDRSLIASLGTPEWLMLCGNCNKVHDIVDSAAAEGELVGKSFG